MPDASDWFASKRSLTTLPKLVKMIDYAEELRGQLLSGDDREWVSGRYLNLLRMIETCIPTKPEIPGFFDSRGFIPLTIPLPSSPVGEEVGKRNGMNVGEE